MNTTSSDRLTPETLDEIMSGLRRITAQIAERHGDAAGRLFARAFALAINGRVNASIAFTLLRAIMRDGDNPRTRAMVAEIEGGGR